MVFHRIYLLHEREFINKNVNIFKIGKTKQENVRRIQSYPKGSNLKFITDCDDCDAAEKDLILIFKNKFIQEINIGTEYFVGDPNEMKKEIMNYFENIENNFCLKDKSEDGGSLFHEQNTLGAVTDNFNDNNVRNEIHSTSYSCNICKFFTANKFDFMRHCKTLKHKTQNNKLKKVFKCNECSVVYKTNSGLWRHRKNCKAIFFSNIVKKYFAL